LSETQANSEPRPVGVVIGHSSRSSYDRSGVVIFPSVPLHIADGRTAEFQNSIGTNSPPRVGDEVTVLYDPGRPEDAKVAPGDTFKINVKLLLVVGAMFLAVVAFMFLSVFASVVWVTLS